MNWQIYFKDEIIFLLIYMANYIVPDTDTENRKCYICLSNREPIIYACLCKGTNYGTHRKCLQRWIETSEVDRCSICKYKYKYNRTYSPSCERLKKKLFDCERKEITGNDSSFILIILIMIFSSLIIFLIAIFGLDYKVSLLPLFYFLFQNIVIFCFKMYDDELSYLTSLKLWSFTSSTFMYGFIIFIFYTNYTDCRKSCIEQEYNCNSNCTQFVTYQKNKENINSCLMWQVGMNIFLILTDILTKIFLSQFIKEIKEYKIENYNRRISFCDE